MNRLACLLCVLIVVALVLPYCDGRRIKKLDIGDEAVGEENERGWKHHKEGHEESHKDGHHKGGHHKEGHHKEGHQNWGHKHWDYFRQKYGNLSLHFVEDSLPPNIYVVLADKGIEVKAIYEMLGNSTAITKVGVRVGDKNLVVSSNGNLAIDGVQSTLEEFTPIEFESGSIKKERRGKLVVTYGSYQLFLRVPRPLEHENDLEHSSYYVPHVGLWVGVQKSAKVTPTGFIGARISVDPLQYTTPDTIA